MFVPLHVYTEYSFLKSGLTMEKLIGCARKAGFRNLGISDYQVLHGLPHFDELTTSFKINPIFGMDLDYQNLLLSFYIKDENGYLNLVAITNHLQRNEINLDIIKKHASGLILVISSSRINEDNIALVKELYSTFDETYIGLEYYNAKDDDSFKELKSILPSMNYVAFPHVLYLKSEDAIVLKIADAISNDATLDEKTAFGPYYFHLEDEIKSLYSEKEINNSEVIASHCNFKLKKTRGKMVKYSEDSKTLLRELCQQGLKDKKIDDEKYYVRLNEELSIIDKMGYNDYFLIVRDYVKYAKSNDIYVGPGRGSAAGSLVSFALDITTPDPIKYDLLFERFLNPERQTMPDIDVDFEDIHRDKVIEYISNRYGKDRVSFIITYQTIGAKQALRDIGRVFNYDSYDIDYLSKSLGNMTVSFKTAYRTIPSFKKLVDSDPLYLEIVKLASKIEGLIRQNGIHAAGIIINDEPLDNSLPLIVQNDSLVTQYEMNYLESQGYLKMDILALRNLTTIHKIMNAIGRNDYYHLPIDDEKALKLIQNNITMGIFQLESRGMKNAISILSPNNFNDVVALLALFRPGPMDMIPLYAKRKKNQEIINYPSDAIKSILEPTYGIIVYQEQIIQIAVKMAGFSLAKADNFRRAISKKDNEKLLKLKDDFITGAIKNGSTKSQAIAVFEHIYKFADYGFNKAHSVSYAMIAMMMAYLKAHYPLPFYSCLLDSENSFNNSKFNEYVSELKKLKIELKVPNINLSCDYFSIENNALRFPLTSIRGIPYSIVSLIIKERKENGNYVDFFSFVSRTYKLGINENHITRLINAGAFDDFSNRASLRASIPNALMNAKYLSTMENSLLNDSNLFLHYDVLHREDDPLENIKKEYETIGIMISNSPFSIQKERLKKENITSYMQALNSFNIHKIVGMITTLKVIKTKNATQMAYITMVNDTESIETTVFPNVYQECWQFLKVNNIIVVEGRKDRKNLNSFIALNIYPLEEER